MENITGDSSPLDGKISGEFLKVDAYNAPVVIDIPNYWQNTARLKLPVKAQVQITAFPQGDVKLFKNEEDFNASMEENTGAQVAVESYIPSGTFKPNGETIYPPQAMAIMSGRIIESQHKINPESNLEFWALSVATLGGVIDVVTSNYSIPDDQISEHNIIWGTFLLSGILLVLLS